MDLIKVENITALELFTQSGVDPLLGKITEEVRKFVPDISSKKGREEVASMAYKVAKTKTYLDDLGKDLVSDWKAKSKTVDDSRKKIRDSLDALKEEVRAPLTLWENKETERLKKHEANISHIESYLNTPSDLPSSTIKIEVQSLDSLVIDDSWEEFKDRATRSKEASMRFLVSLLDKVSAREAEQAELKRLREEAAARELKEREQKIAEEAARKAKEEAELKAKLEQKKIEEEKETAVRKQKETEQLLKDEQERSRLAAIKAEEDKKRAELQAAENERKRALLVKQKEEEDQAKREASVRHRKKINNAALEGLTAIPGVSPDLAKSIIEAIARDQVPHIKIHY